MEITVSFSDDVTILRLQGKFVAGRDGPFFRQRVKELVDSGKRKLLLDFSDVPYIDSTGLGFLAGSRKTVEQAGACLVLSALNERVKKVLDEVKISGFFVIAQDETAGVAKLQSMPES
ncbi:MAG: STAS domain-containing protein [Acidobacteriota bacterium]